MKAVEIKNKQDVLCIFLFGKVMLKRVHELQNPRKVAHVIKEVPLAKDFQDNNGEKA